MKLKSLLSSLIAMLAFTAWAQTSSDLINNAARYYAEYKNLFKDEICTELKDAYNAMSEEQFLTYLGGYPQELVDLVLVLDLFLLLDLLHMRHHEQVGVCVGKG